MRILVIEDEPLVARDILGLVKNLEPEAELLGPLSSVSASREWFSKNSMPDLILSDIQLSDGISFEIFEQLSIHCPIIFTTAYDAYAIRAFKLNSIDYLLKPIDSRELALALKKYNSLTVDTSFQEQLRTALREWGTQKKFKDRFLAQQRNTLVPLSVQQIAYFHKEELVYIHTLDGEKLISEQGTLDEIESLLDPSQFFRVNRQYLVHIQMVGRIKTTHKGLSVLLKAPYNLELDISREKATDFKRWAAS